VPKDSVSLSQKTFVQVTFEKAFIHQVWISLVWCPISEQACCFELVLFSELDEPVLQIIWNSLRLKIWLTVTVLEIYDAVVLESTVVAYTGVTAAVG